MIDNSNCLVLDMISLDELPLASLAERSEDWFELPQNSPGGEARSGGRCSDTSLEMWWLVPCVKLQGCFARS